MTERNGHRPRLLATAAGDVELRIPELREGSFFPGGKGALPVAVIETTGTIYRELGESIAQDASDPAHAYVDFFDGAAAMLEESGFIDPCPIGTVAREVANTNEPLRAAAAELFDSWIEAATRRLVDAGVVDEHAAQLAPVFVATVEGTFVLNTPVDCSPRRGRPILRPARGAGNRRREKGSNVVGDARSRRRSRPDPG